MLIKPLAKALFSSAAIFKTALGLTLFLTAWYLMPNHSGPFELTGMLLDRAEHTIDAGTVSYEFRLKGQRNVESGEARVLPSGYFYIHVPDIDIEFVRITGIWRTGVADQGENLLAGMPISEDTDMLFKPGALFRRHAWHWSPDKHYIFQEGKPVRMAP